MDKETREFLENMQELRAGQEEIIENQMHLKLYQEGMDEFEKDNTTYTYDEVLKELGLKKETL